MKPFIILALCCSFFSSRATPLPFEILDCDDPDVFKAVDTALKKYNGDKASGNQFALYMVMEAKRTAGPDTQFHVKYRIQETTCTIEENKLWQDCDYKALAEATRGECTAQVHVNNDEKTSSVSQDCKIFPATPRITLTDATCLGCFHPVSSDSSEVSEILKQAIWKFNRHSAEPALFKLVEIKEAKRQVVAGWNYIIKYEIEETNCSKEQFQDLTPECKPTSRGLLRKHTVECYIQEPLLFKNYSLDVSRMFQNIFEALIKKGMNDNVRVGKCDAKAYENLHAEIVDIANQCTFPVEDTVLPAICAGCPKTIPTDSPELKELLKVSMEKYNSESNDDFYYKSGEIEAATVQVVAGQNYRLIFAIWKTNCSKKDFDKLNEDCEAASDSAPLACEANIYVIPWENKTFPQVNCSRGRSTTVLVRRPPGFTPFRSFPVLQQPTENSSSEKNEERQRPGKEMRKDGGEEPEGEDRPESHVRRCPGKPWKQITDLPAPSFPREFTNEDLLPSTVENINPATQNSTPENEKLFDLSDALV